MHGTGPRAARPARGTKRTATGRCRTGKPPRGPQPLVREIAAGVAYPADALGPLRRAVIAVQGITQAPLAIPAKSALASLASLAVQGLADVETLGGAELQGQHNPPPIEGAGRIGITFCPGKIQPGAMSGSWNRDLWLNPDAIAVWCAVAVVTLIEDHELQALKVAAMGGRGARPAPELASPADPRRLDAG